MSVVHRIPVSRDERDQIAAAAALLRQVAGDFAASLDSGPLLATADSLRGIVDLWDGADAPPEPIEDGLDLIERGELE